MKLRLLLLSLFFSFSASANSVSGIVKLDKKVEPSVTPTSVLFIYARKMGVRRGPPLAVLRVANPKFPYNFSLSKENAMMPGTPFKGPFELTARLTSNGDAFQRTGSFQGILSKEKGIQIGSTKNIIIIDRAR